jgi:hypothetical protein
MPAAECEASPWFPFVRVGLRGYCVVSGREVFAVKLSKRFFAAATLVAALTIVGGSAALSLSGPITKQNGSTPVFHNFTSICAVAGAISSLFPTATVVAAPDGTAHFSYQTADPSGLGFDLNILYNQWDLFGTTVVTSYWSNQAIQVLNPDGTLYVPNV